jgi:hypothetical protein
MTPPDIIARLFSAKGVTADRVRKAQGMAIRNRIDWALVLAAMTDEQRAQVEQA